MPPFPQALAAPAILAELTGMPTFLQNVSYQVVGMLIVLAALGLLSLAVSLLGWLLPVVKRQPAPAAAAPAVDRPAPLVEGADGRILAAIAAAVASVVSRPHRIVMVKPDPEAQQAWSAEGRRAIYQSHKIR
ncbi:MAG: OadG family transporter subunit [Opitutaceae bacterium]|nr:OadG family transporter subunit [Opitutaceae bacterium]